jgi:hypothetical protein
VARRESPAEEDSINRRRFDPTSSPTVATQATNEAATAHLPIVHLLGVGTTSPLACLLRARLDELARLVPTGEVAPAPVGWRRAVAGTSLQWYGEREGRAEAAAKTADLVIDLHGWSACYSGSLWRIVDAGGECVLRPFFAVDRCRRPEGVVSLFLLESTDCGVSWAELRQAHLSASQR